MSEFAVTTVARVLTPNGWQQEGDTSWRKTHGRQVAWVRVYESGAIYGRGYLPLLMEAGTLLANADLLPTAPPPPRKSAPPHLQHLLSDPLYDNEQYRRLQPHCAQIRDALIPFDGWQQESSNSWIKRAGTRSVRIIRFDDGALYGQGYLPLVAEAAKILQQANLIPLHA